MKKNSAEILYLKGNTSNLTCSGLIDDALKSATFLTQTVVLHGLFELAQLIKLSVLAFAINEIDI